MKKRILKMILMLWIILPFFFWAMPHMFAKTHSYFAFILSWYFPPLLLWYWKYYLGNSSIFRNSSMVHRPPFRFIKRKNPSDSPLVGVEVGVFEGRHAKKLLNGYLNIRKLYLVDPWVPYDGGDNSEESQNQRFLRVKEQFKDNKKIEIIRLPSVEAAKGFENGLFDFVYIDADHSHDAVLEDLEAWYPKLKKYGVLCGDDFGHPSGDGVVSAVTEFAYAHKLLVFSEGTQFWMVKT